MCHGHVVIAIDGETANLCGDDFRLKNALFFAQSAGLILGFLRTSNQLLLEFKHEFSTSV